MARRMYPSDLRDATDPAEICRMLESWADLGANEYMPKDVTAILAMYTFAVDCQEHADRVERERDALYRAMERMDRNHKKWVRDTANELANRLAHHRPDYFGAVVSGSFREMTRAAGGPETGGSQGATAGTAAPAHNQTAPRRAARS